jgi:uncharacterized protein with PQ loop repeat
MEPDTIALLAGFISGAIFISSNLPMVIKAWHTKNLNSYSLAHIGLANLGNLIHWVYIAALPAGPVWLLHGFNTLVATFMLFLYLRYEMDLPHKLCGWFAADVWKLVEALGQFAPILMPIFSQIGLTPPQPQIYPVHNIIN